MVGSGGVPDVTHTKDVRKGDLRESIDVKTGAIVGSCRKRRLFVCDIACPRSLYDLRVALNEETPAEPEPGNPNVSNVREKKRMSFPIDFFRVDITEVPGGGTSYEVELDFSAEDSRQISPLTVAKLLSSSFEILSRLKR